MKQKILHYIAAIIFATSVGGVAATATVTTQPVGAACQERLLTFPAWYKGLVDKNSCEVKSPTDSKGISKFIWTIVLNVIEMLLQVVAYAAVGYIIWGGFRYMTSTGLPDKMTAARKTITNAVIGLVISMMSIALVNVIAGAIQ